MRAEDSLTVGLVLAAGSASRFGEQKLLVPIRGKPLIRWPVEAAVASGVARTVVVVGSEGEEVGRALKDLPVAVIYNPDHDRGMASSIRTGIGALPADVEWAVILLGDQPGVDADLVDRVLAERTAGRPIVAPVYRGVQGNPVAFHTSVFPELQALEGDSGGRPVVEREPGRVTRLELDRPIPDDVDTPEDLGELGFPGQEDG